MKRDDVLLKLHKLANPKNVEGMARFGINPENTLGISIVELREIAKKLGKNHNLAIELWDSGIHEARLLAGFVDEVDKINEVQMDRWVKDFDSWDICDQVCMNLFDKTPFVFKKIEEWSYSDREFVKRASFSLMAVLAVHDKKLSDDVFENFLYIIKRESTDERNYVRKAVNWALRQIGKRNLKLNKKAIKIATEISKIDSKSARWIASDALRELKSEAVQKRLNKKV